MAKKTATKKTASKPAAKAKINKSKLIRDYAETHPRVGPTETARTLSAEHQTTISASMVSNALGKVKGRKKKSVKKTSAKPRMTMPSDDLKSASSHLIQAVELVASAGAKEARMLIDLAERVIARVRK